LPADSAGAIVMHSKLLAGLLACGVCFAAGGANAGALRPAKPSLEGNWTAHFILTMEATPDTPDLVVSEAASKPIAAAQGKALSDLFASFLDPEVPQLVPTLDGLPLVRGQRRTRLVVQPADGRLPYTAAARKKLAAPPPPPRRLDNPEQFGDSERCLVGLGQPPLNSFAFENTLQIIRTPDAVVLHVEVGDEVRVVPIADRHAPKATWTRLGDSIGHWEGQTLVIETVGQPDNASVRFAPTMLVPGGAKVIERLTPVSDRELNYQFTVVDPKTYAAPWLAEFSWFRSATPLHEFACHEGNYSLPDTLAGARYEDAHPASAGGAH
jgi:hypothetical protein